MICTYYIDFCITILLRQLILRLPQAILIQSNKKIGLCKEAHLEQLCIQDLITIGLFSLAHTIVTQDNKPIHS